MRAHAQQGYSVLLSVCLFVRSFLAVCAFEERSRARLRVVGHGYCAALKECADLGFVVN